MARNVVGIPFRNPTRYVGPGANLVPITKVPREPLATDNIYPLGQFWLIDKNPTTGTVGDLWYLCDYNANLAVWCQLIMGAVIPTLNTLSGSNGTIILPSGNNIRMLASTVANGTNATFPLYANDTLANEITYEIQAGAARAGAPGNRFDAGIVSFDDTAFAVDANGFVTFIGAGVGTVIFNAGDDAVSVSPDGAGIAGWLGLTVANATHAKPVFFKDSATPNALDLDVQVGAAITGAPGDSNDAGLVSFDDTEFTVDANGFVALAGTVGTVISNSGDDAISVNPDGAGDFKWAGLAVANGAHAKPIFFKDSVTANTIDLDVQVAAAITGAPGDKNDAGIASFDDNLFITDTDGYTTSTAIVATPGVSNLGIDYNGGTGVFTVTSADGTALSATNPAYVTMQSKSDAGKLITIKVTANQDFIDDVGASEIINNLFGLDTGIAYGNSIPFYIYAVTNDSENAIAFMLSRIPHRTISPLLANIGDPSSSVADTQGSFWSLEDITETEFDENPCLLVGSFRMQMSASDDWTLLTLDESDGIGQFQEKKGFTMPTGVFGSASGTFWQANAGTEPTFNTGGISYVMGLDGIVDFECDLGNVNNVTSGSQTLSLTLPYISLTGGDGMIGHYVTGATRRVTMGTVNGGTQFITAIFFDGGTTPFVNTTFGTNDDFAITIRYRSITS